jgi:AraC-like DNA-binding protein
MSRALAVFHGRFGRATVYQLNRPFNIHAHREGHLIFHVGGRSACIDVSDGRYELTEGSVVAVNPWEPHNFLPSDLEGGAVFFVLYVNAEWFAPDAPGADRLRFGRTQFTRSVALDKHIRHAAALVCGAPSLNSLDGELRSLIDICYDESWQQAATARDPRANGSVTDFRVRKCIKMMSESPGAEIELDTIARESGLSRPHFYRLFRTQTGVTPHLYLNTLMMEQALEALVASAFSLPALMSPSEDESWSPPRLTRPAIRSCLSGAAPLNGMCVISIFASLLSASPSTCMVEPGPVEP